MPDSPSNSLEQRMTRALETPPAVHIPADFAAGVATEARTRFGPMPHTLPVSHFGPLALRIAVGVLLLAMLLLARYAGTLTAFSFTFEATLCAEFIGLTIYLGLNSREIH